MNNPAEQIASHPDSVAVEVLADRVITQVSALLEREAIYPNAVQKKMLHSHLQAMAYRSLTGEPLPVVDAELFDDIAPAAISLAQEIVDLFGNLPQEEAWLLSVHIAVAQAQE